MEGTKEQIEKALRTYTQSLSRLEYIGVEIDILKQRHDALCTEREHTEGIHETDTETIEALTFARNVDGMPGPKNMQGSKVENIADTYKKVQQNLQKPHSLHSLNTEITQIEQKLSQYQDEQMFLKQKIAKTKALLKCLSKEEKFVIEQQFFERISWKYIVRAYYETFGEFKEMRTLQRYSQSALQKMQNIAIM